MNLFIAIAMIKENILLWKITIYLFILNLFLSVHSGNIVFVDFFLSIIFSKYIQINLHVICTDLESKSLSLSYQDIFFKMIQLIFKL